MEIPDIYVASQPAFEDGLQFMIPRNARAFAQAPRLKVLDFLAHLQARTRLDFPLVVEGLDDLLFYVSPDEREAVLQRMRELMMLRLSQNPRAWVVFVLRHADLRERELPRTVELIRGREHISLHPAFPTSRWQMKETVNAKRYLRVGGLGS
ncbi:MAG: hypothetical protein H8D78_01975 [Chloroflexi bacterium]|nr:hypothetical protein [Chloroflexota bacterium]